MTDSDQDVPLASPLQNTVQLVGAGLLVLFALGMSAGIVASASKHNGFSFKTTALFLIPTILVIAASIIIKPALKASRLPKSPRMRQAQIATYGCIALGIVIGFILALSPQGSRSDPFAIFTAETTIAPLFVAGLIASMLVVCWLSILWLRNIDEHERAAHDFGAVLAIYSYFALSVGWWALWRGGFVIVPDGLIIFCIVLIVWTIGWLYRRFT